MAAAATTKPQNATKDSGSDMIKRITLKELNPHLICVLCRGYFIDPVTIVECLHSFCKTCIVEHIKQHKLCPICDTQINKTKPYLSMRLDKALQNIVYKLVPGLYSEEMERRKKFNEKNEPTKVPKAELEKHFFFCDDRISMSLEYYDTEKATKNNNVNEEKNGQNPNKRYLACPGTVKIRHLMKFITMKYGLNSDTFVVDVIYKGDIIPQDYTLIDVAYYYKWEKQAPMQFHYRIFKKNKVLLKRKKRKSKSEDKITDAKKPRPAEFIHSNENKNDSPAANGKANNNNNSKNGSTKDNAKNGTDIIGCRTVNNHNDKVTENKKQQPPKLKDETKAEKVPKTEKFTKTETKVEKKEVEIPKPPPVLKPIVTKKEEIKESDESSDDDDEPSEKKLKIDESVEPNIAPPTPSENIKIKVSLSDVKKVETKTELKSPPKKVEEIVKKEEKKDIIKPLKPSAIKSPTVKPPTIKTNIKPAIKPVIKPTIKPTIKPQTTNNVIKPKLISNASNTSGVSNTTSPSNKSRNNHMLSDIVNNLAKKQLQATTPPPPSSLLGGQTTITKKDTDTIKEAPKVTPKVNEAKKDPNTPKGIPSGTSVTIRNADPVSNSNAFKQKNGMTSMADFVQASKSPKVSPSPPTPSSPKKTLSDLRQFRKEPQSKNGAKSPIIPSLTSRTLTLGNSKAKTTSSNTSSSTTTSSNVLSKPLPKPGEASSSASNFNNYNNLSALAYGILAQDEANRANLLRSIACGMFPPMSMPTHPPTPPSMSQQLPSNRLKLTVSNSSKNSPVGQQNPLQMLPSLASHMAPDTQWKFLNPLGASNGATPPSTTPSGSKFGTLGLGKTLNQSIRQIPNPSLLTKQTSEQQQILRAYASAAQQQAAAAFAASNARTSLSQ